MTPDENRTVPSPRWLNPFYRADLAKRFDCAPAQVEWHLKQREKMVEALRQRDEYCGRTQYD